jgi:hypothetical protein
MAMMGNIQSYMPAKELATFVIFLGFGRISKNAGCFRPLQVYRVLI